MPDPVNLAFAFGLPPARAIEYFKGKGYAISWNWFEVWQEAQAKAFTVARVTRMEILESIRQALDDALANGTQFRTFVDTLEPELRRMGWWGKQIIVDSEGNAEKVQLGSVRRLETIFRTNIQTAYMAGRFKYLEEVKGKAPYWQWVAVMDTRTRPGHAALHGKIWRADDKFWNTFYPPIGFNCRCRVRPLTEGMMTRRGLTAQDTQLLEREVDAGVDKRTGETKQATVSGVTVRGRDGKDTTVWADPGWNYNPGKVAFTPDPSRYKKDLSAIFKRDQQSNG
jgi:SPP1 gp7 family putative phage head morphogenesis protein